MLIDVCTCFDDLNFVLWMGIAEEAVDPTLHRHGVRVAENVTEVSNSASLVVRKRAVLDRASNDGLLLTRLIGTVPNDLGDSRRFD
jgi:hypothetical protein